jgi:Peptidase family M41/C-terminal, D2-small domain, of ClpB protein/ATPase family associated with various cellular activities (AAA)
MKINRTLIDEKKQQLERIKLELKEEFVGIDYIIDDLLDYIQIWYLMPEILTRPIIVNLWGMTGVGKTDLVRKLVSKLHYQDRFAEVELSNSENSSGSWRNSVWSILDDNGLNDGQPSIVLFDEIQKFATLDSTGQPLLNVRFQDFWELLSDGKLAKRDNKEDINQYLNTYLFSASQRKKQLAQNTEEGVDPNPTIGIWEANRLKKLFDLEQDALVIAELTTDEILGILQERKSRKKIYEAVNHAKTLIIISGNLDDAFTMSNATGEADIDADIFHAFTEKITIIDIKSALTRKFRPEQVARFGNIHLIYNSLKKEHFQKIIANEITRIIEKTKIHFRIDITVDDSLKQLIYQNGVFPAQGVRPVFSSVIDILEANLSKLLFDALITRARKISIAYDYVKHEINARVGAKRDVVIKYVGRIDKIRDSNLADLISNVSVHESGHAVAYAVLFGLAALQLKSKVASTYVSGFTFPHQIYQTRKSLLDKIKVYLAGGIAEEIIFGKDRATVGRENDREEATKLAMGYIRRYGFHEDFQAYYTNEPGASMDLDVTDTAIEKLLRKMSKETSELLKKHRPFLEELSKELLALGNLTSVQIAVVAEKNNVKVQVKEEGYLHIENYENFLK